MNAPDGKNTFIGDIVVVDDSLDNLKLLSGILVDAGYEVRPANSGELAIRTIKAKFPDLIIADILMPEMDGYEFCKIIKSMPETKGIPLIFISALGEGHDKVRAFNEGAVDFISKPFKHEEILARIKTHISLKRSESELENRNMELMSIRDSLQIEIEKATSELTKVNIELKKEIAEGKRNLEMLEKSENKYHFLVDSLLNGIWTIDEYGNTSFVNSTLAKMLGYPENEMLGRHLFSFMDEEGIRKAKYYLKRREEGIIEDHDFEFLKKDGTRIYTTLSTNPVLDEKGNYKGALAAVNDITERKRASEELQKSENRYKLLLSSVTDYVYTVSVKDGAPVSTFHGHGCAKVTGYTSEEFSNDTYLWYRIIFDQDRELVVEQSKKILDIKEVSALEHRIIHKDGSIRWVQNIPVIRCDEFGNITSYDGLISDITERKRIESIKQKNHRNTESLWNLAKNQYQNQDNFYDFILEEIIRMTESKFAFYGFINNDESVMTIYSWTKNALELCQTIDKPFNYPIAESGIWGDAIRKRQVIIVNDYNQNFSSKRGLPNGHVNLTRLVSMPIFSKDKIVAVSVVANKNTEYTEDEIKQLEIFLNNAQIINEYRNKEEALRRSEEKFRNLFEHTIEGIFISDANNNLVNVNPSGCKMLGYSQEELLSLNIADIINPDEHKNLSPNKDKILKGEIVTGETLLKSKDGDLIITEFNSRILPDGNIITIIRNISERKKIERERFRLQNLESLGILAGGIAHDFNNLLTSIMGNASLVQESIKDEKSKKCISRIINSSKDATNLTQQLLTFAIGGSPLKKESSLNQLIENAIKSSPEDCNIFVDFKSDENIIIDADPDQILQAINNIIINAKEAMPNGGKIKISISKSIKKDNLFNKIIIQDTGIGIPKENLDKIFDPYFSTKPKGYEKGSGLGLSITYSIINKHGGEIVVNSEVGKGTTFEILLPAIKKIVRDDVKPIKNKVRKRPEKKLNVLIMDDEELVREVLYDLLTFLGHSATMTTKGEETIECYLQSIENNEPYDIVILDLKVDDGMGGRETLKRLRKINPKIVTIVSSGYSEGTLSGYKIEGFDGKLNKPYTLNELNDTMLEVLNK